MPQADFTGLNPPWKPDSLRLADHPGPDLQADKEIAMF
jgi:hypothetical protein